MMHPKPYILAALLLFACLSPASAQELTQEALDAAADEVSLPRVDLSVSASGKVGTTASVTAHVENISENTASFAWYLDDELAPRQTGVARMTFSFVTTKPAHRVRVVVSEGGTMLTENTASVRASSVALVWHTDTFVPADYEGKALPSVGSRVTAFALPEIGNEKPENLLYTWYVDAESQVRGIAGEQEFSFTITKNVSFVSLIVEVSNQAQSQTARQGITIPVMRPTVVLDPSTPLFIAAGTERIVRALPFYFHVSKLNELSFVWNFAGKSAVGAPPDPNALSLVIPKDSGRGAQPLLLEVTSQRALGEDARAEIEVTIL